MSIRIPEEWPKESEILKTSKQTLENNSETTVQTLIISCEVKVAQSCPTLCDPMDYSPPVTSVHGNLQAKILMRVAISYFRGSSWHRGRTQVSCIAGRFFTIWATREVQEYWSGQPVPSPGDLPDPGIQLRSLALLSLLAELLGRPLPWTTILNDLCALLKMKFPGAIIDIPNYLHFLWIYSFISYHCLQMQQQPDLCKNFDMLIVPIMPQLSPITKNVSAYL